MPKTTNRKSGNNFDLVRTGIARKQITGKVPHFPILEKITPKPKFIKKENKFSTLPNAELDKSYHDLLLETLKEITYHCYSTGEALTETALETVQAALITVVSAAQAGQIPPEKLRTMLAQSARQSLMYARWKPQAGLESYHNLMIGSSKTVKVY